MFLRFIRNIINSTSSLPVQPFDRPPVTSAKLFATTRGANMRGMRQLRAAPSPQIIKPAANVVRLSKFTDEWSCMRYCLDMINKHDVACEFVLLQRQEVLLHPLRRLYLPL
jgi:hypothetical protein